MGNFTNPENITSLIGVFSYVNDVTQNLFWAILLLAIFILILIGFMMYYPREDSLAGSSFVCLLLALLLRAGDLVRDWIVILFFVMIMVSVFLLWKSQEG